MIEVHIRHALLGKLTGFLFGITKIVLLYVSNRFPLRHRAKCFVDKLPGSVRTISQLYIRVALPQDNYPTQEQMLIDIAHEMNRIKQFKDFCVQLKKKTGREVRWSWLRVGILESIGNLGLNNFDSDDD